MIVHLTSRSFVVRVFLSAVALLVGALVVVSVWPSGGSQASFIGTVAYAVEGEPGVAWLGAEEALDTAEAELGQEVYLPQELPDSQLNLVEVTVDPGPPGVSSPMRRVGVKFAVGHAGDPENGEPADFGPLHITVIEHLTHGVNPGTPDPETVEISTGTLYAWRAPDDALQRAGEFIDWYTLVAADGPSYTLSVVAAEASLRPSQDAMVTMIESFVPRSEFD